MDNTLTHRQRALIAIKGGKPDYVPTFELVFEETKRDFQGREFFGKSVPPQQTSLNYEQICQHNVQLYLDIARKFDHSIIYIRPFNWPYEENYQQVVRMIEIIRDKTGDEFCLMAPGDPTYRIPADPVEFSMRMYDEPEQMKKQAQANVDILKPIYKTMMDAGADGFIFTSDYAMNTGTFLSPPQFAEFIIPYLTQAVQNVHDLSGVVIKHSDGNLMAVMDALIQTGIDALHSIDPMADMDIKQIKQKYGKQICLCGNVHCAWMQTGTTEQIRSSAEYCLEHAKPAGGYIFSTSNCVFHGMPLQSYDLIHKIWMQKRGYE
ncbi:MAG: hypothetical protein JW936_03715 [Sedimentisphaerales bacterium]|nr:hypothetical protein [Sedimentisphaerales bacterium]